MKVGLDFDRVLFDTDSFKQHLNEKLPGFSETYSEARENNLYNPEKHAELLEVEVEEIFKHIEHARNFLYADIDELNEIEHELVIVSRGDQEFQELKIQESGILEYVSDYTVVEEGDKQVAGINALVDDREKELEQVDVPGLHFKRPEERLTKVKNWLGKIEE